ncbi:hypothetical protein EV715DRAFT_212157 [Schizophyllum commune]
MQLPSPHNGEDHSIPRSDERDRNMHDDLKAELGPLKQDSDHLKPDSRTLRAQLTPLKNENDNLRAARALAESEATHWRSLVADLCPIAARVDALKKENTLLHHHIAVLKSQYDELMDLLQMVVQLMAANEAREAVRSSPVQHDSEYLSSTPMAPSRDDGSSAMDQSPASYSSISPVDLQIGI